MLFFFLMLISPVFAQMDLSGIQDLDEKLPTDQSSNDTNEVMRFVDKKRNHISPLKPIYLENIIESGTQLGAINPGAVLRNLETDKGFEVTKPIYVRFFNQEDEFGFRYIQNKNSTVTWRIESRRVESIREELVLYEPPHRYTPAPKNIIRANYDTKLAVPPEVSFYAGFAQGSYMQDLFEDKKAGSGLSTQYGLHFFTQWKLPVKAGFVVHYEVTTYNLSRGEVSYSAPSFGPQFKTNEFQIFDHPIRFQAQFRYSPFARTEAETSAGVLSYKFNSADLLSSLERPIKNKYGEFVVGVYFQSQWLNLKEQKSAVNVNATNETNKSFGFSLAQVFE